MPHCDLNKLSLIHIPKNAGTSVSKLLNLKRLGHYRYINEKSLNPSHFFFCIKRHPVSRFLSCFRYSQMKKSHWHWRTNLHPDYKKLKEASIDDCLSLLADGKLAHQGWRPQHYWAVDKRDHSLPDQIISFENLQEDLFNLGDALHLKIPQPIPHINQSSTPLRALTQHQISKIQNHYREDFEIFNYD